MMLMVSVGFWRVFVLSVGLVVFCCFLVFSAVVGLSGGVEGFVAWVFVARCGCFGVDAVCRCDACAGFCGCHGG